MPEIQHYLPAHTQSHFIRLRNSKWNCESCAQRETFDCSAGCRSPKCDALWAPSTSRVESVARIHREYGNWILGVFDEHCPLAALRQWSRCQSLHMSINVRGYCTTDQSGQRHPGAETMTREWALRDPDMRLWLHRTEASWVGPAHLDLRSLQTGSNIGASLEPRRLPTYSWGRPLCQTTGLGRYRGTLPTDRRLGCRSYR